MKKTLYASLATVALGASLAHADGHLVFTPGEGDFSWDAYEAYAAGAPDLSGQTVTVFGPWLAPEDDVFRSAIYSNTTQKGKKVKIFSSCPFIILAETKVKYGL